MFLLTLLLPCLKLDPLLLANIKINRVPQKIMSVKIQNAELGIFFNPYETKRIPTYSVKRISEKMENCLKSSENVEKCFSEEMIYIRLPRKLHLLGSIDEKIPKRRFEEKVKESDQEIGASIAREMYKLSGKKTIVGIIDTGVKWNSRWLSFKIKDDLSPLIQEGEERNISKVMHLWDQRTLRDQSIPFPKGMTYPDGFTYGFECIEPARRSEILPGYNSCISDDQSGHGTHIAGIVSMETDDESGVAPHSAIIAVPTNLYEDEVLDAVDYIFKIAEKLNLPAVINISLGGHFGPHDGTSLFETLLTQKIGEGRIIVAAAGNEGQANIHIGGTYMGDLSTIVSIRDDCEIQFWFPMDSGVELEITFKGKSAKVKKGERQILFSAEEKISLIDFTSSADVPMTYLLEYSLSERKESAVFVSLGEVGQAQIKITFPKTTYFDAWISSDPSSCFFTESGDIKPSSENTIAVPATAKEIIAVGYYIITEGENKGKISPNSSIGTENNGKPNITAPGSRIYSLCSGSDEYLCSGSGSSQATPHVSGAIALALERNPNLTPTEIINFLCQSAKTDQFTGQTPNKIWGCGKLRVPEFISLIIPKSNPFSEYKLYYSIGSETKFNNSFKTLKLSSDYPFRILGPNFQDYGWSKNHKLYLKEIPEYVDVEFLDGNSKKFNLIGEGIKIQEGLPKNCGCFISSQSNIASISYLLLISLIVKSYLSILRYRIRRKKERKQITI